MALAFFEPWIQSDFFIYLFAPFMLLGIAVYVVLLSGVSARRKKEANYERTGSNF